MDNKTENTKELLHLLKKTNDELKKSFDKIKEQENTLLVILKTNNADVMKLYAEKINYNSSNLTDEDDYRLVLTKYLASIVKLKKKISKGLKSVDCLYNLILIDCIDIDSYSETIEKVFKLFNN